jgi:DNA repair exonuclease SbcCD ATPase subunit
VYDFAKFKDDFAKYCTIYEQNQRALNERTSLERELKEKRESLESFFESYKINAGTFQDRYFALCSDIERYLNLKSENESFLKGTKERGEEVEKLNAEVAQILNRYGILPRVDIRSQLEEILADSGEYARLNEGIRREKLEAENYKKDNSLGDMPQITESDRYIDARLSKNRHDLAVVEGQIADVESMVEKLDEKRAKLENEENTLAAYKQKYRLLCATADALKQAEQNLKLRYIAPIRDKFLTYADALETALGERVVMGRDYTLAFERGGEVRSDRHLSSGQRSLCALCFRLALIDNIFEGEKPFVIMDDPFVNLDSEHMKKTCSLLAKLSKDLQIIYFTCHQSRVLK